MPPYSAVKVDALDAGWWDLDQLDDGLQMAKNHDTLDPKGAFTALVLVEDVPNTKDCTFIAKFKDTAGSRGWRLRQSSGTIYAGASTDGSTETSASFSNTDASGIKALIALTLDASNNLMAYHISLAAGEASVQKSSSTALGGTIAGTPAKATIGLLQDDTVGVDGKMYYAMTIDRELSEQELVDLFFGLLRPDRIIPRPSMYWDGHQAVASTYKADFPEGNDENIYFDVEGSPTHGGVSTSSRGTGNPEGSYYDFNGTNAALRLAGTDPEAAAFDPALNGNDFTVVGVLAPDTVTTAPGIFGKFNINGVDKRCWVIIQVNDGLRFIISKDGTGDSEKMDYVDVASALSIGVKSFFCGRYAFAGDGVSDLRLDVDGAETSKATAPGPIYSDTGADVQIADYDHASDRFYDGKLYWLAYYSRRLTSEEVWLLRVGWLKPWEVSGLVMYWDGSKAITATYRTEFPDWGGITFGVEGTPAQGGSTEASYLDDPTNSWWDTDGVDDALALLGTDARAVVFDPASNNNDFTVAGVIAPDVVSGMTHARWIVGKSNPDTERCWYVVQDDTQMGFGISDDGTNPSNVPVLGSLSIGVKSFFCARYKYSGSPGTTSDMRLNVDGSETENISARGPIFSSTGADVKIADGAYATPTLQRHFDGKTYWLAYWNRKLTNREVDALEDGTVHPLALNPDWYWDGHQAVEATYHSDAPWGTPPTFAVNGNPVKSGSSYPTIENTTSILLELPLHRSIDDIHVFANPTVHFVAASNLEQATRGIDTAQQVQLTPLPDFVAGSNLTQKTDRGADLGQLVQLPKRRGT